jgi:hypothetical protein
MRTEERESRSPAWAHLVDPAEAAGAQIAQDPVAILEARSVLEFGGGGIQPEPLRAAHSKTGAGGVAGECTRLADAGSSNVAGFV